MFKGFKLESFSFTNDFDKYYTIGLESYNEYKKEVKRSLDSYFLDGKRLNGTEIINSWFPEIKSHVFISHSHKDEKNVIALAGWLKDEFNLDSFIDSCVWGYSNELNQQIDNQYSWLDRIRNIYDYKKVLFSASHVNMMLSTALSSMIDKTECLFLYDTPNSTESFGAIDRTESPWIYFEVAFSETVRKKEPKRLGKVLSESVDFVAYKAQTSIEKALRISYKVDFEHLIEINSNTLNLWKSKCLLSKREKALDKLYEITCPLTK